MKTFWTQFGANVVDHHMHEEGVSVGACPRVRASFRSSSVTIIVRLRLLPTPRGHHTAKAEAVADL